MISIEDQKACRSFPRYNDGARAGSQVKRMLGRRASRALLLMIRGRPGRGKENRMIDIYPYYARCNTQITIAMLDIIKKNPESYSYKTGGFYDSIAAILDHLYISNLNWIKAFSDVIETSLENEIKNINIPEYGTKVFESIIDADIGIRKTLTMSDTICNEIKETDLDKAMKRKRRNGDIIEKTTWKALIHYFNHQTHHRGQISEILDELKIQNDYSNMIFID